MLTWWGRETGHHRDWGTGFFASGGRLGSDLTTGYRGHREAGTGQDRYTKFDASIARSGDGQGYNYRPR